MIKASILAFFIILIIPPRLARASVTINQQSSGQSTTDVIININGQTKTFHAEGNQSVNWTSDDGKSSVKINSQGVSSNVSSGEDAKTPINEKVVSPSVAVNQVNKTLSEEILKILKQRMEFLTQLIINYLKNLVHF